MNVNIAQHNNVHIVKHNNVHIAKHNSDQLSPAHLPILPANTFGSQIFSRKYYHQHLLHHHQYPRHNHRYHQSAEILSLVFDFPVLNWPTHLVEIKNYHFDLCPMEYDFDAIFVALLLRVES